MTNGRGAGMASFMTKKKKYKFRVDVVLEELLEVPFVSAVLFAKLRLLDGGSFQGHSSREEVRDHQVKWGTKFGFDCKMQANASTGVLERCILRISVRKESKGGRSFNKMGFVDLNLAEYAGAGQTYKKALLEGYDARHRQDNSMLKFSIAMHMLSGDILFKVPSPSPKHKSVTSEDINEQRSDDFSSGSIGGSIASGSSGFGSLPKKRPALLSSELVIGQTFPEGSVPPVAPSEFAPEVPLQDHEEVPTCETGHSRNSSNTSQLSKASGYSSIHSHSHSRQSSSGDSGHIRGLTHRPIWKANGNSLPSINTTFNRVNSYPRRLRIPSAVIQEDVFSTPQGHNLTPNFKNGSSNDTSCYFTPESYQKQNSILSTSSADEYRTPNESLDLNRDVFAQKFNDLQKSSSTSLVETSQSKDDACNRRSLDDMPPKTPGVLRSKSEFEIPRRSPNLLKERRFPGSFFNAENMAAFLTPMLKRKQTLGNQSTPTRISPTNSRFKVPTSPIPKRELHSLPETRTTSLSSLRSEVAGNEREQLGVQEVDRNPSSSSLVLSETGSLDRAKAAYERRKKTQVQDSDAGPVSGRVENTRVNPDDFIAELLKDTNLEQGDDSAETSGLQLFIAKDGTAALGNHEVKSQMSIGVQGFKQVVMDDNR